MFMLEANLHDLHERNHSDRVTSHLAQTVMVWLWQASRKGAQTGKKRKWMPLSSPSSSIHSSPLVLSNLYMQGTAGSLGWNQGAGVNM